MNGLDKTTAAKMGLLGSLYLSQGLPFGFFTQALPVLLRQQGYTLEQIGLSSSLAMPWALKFLWAPLVDRHTLPVFGRRKSWIVPLQLATALCLSVVALRATGASLDFVLAVVFVVNLLAATQDIATDGLAVDMLSRDERGLANGIQVGGYRLGMIIGGGALLVVFERFAWAVTFGAMAALVSVATLPILFARERSTPLATGRSAVPEPAPGVHFLRRPGNLRLLGVIVTYKLGDAFATGMLRPFLADRGLSLGDIGVMLGTVGFVAGLVGALAGGAFVNRFGRKRGLLVFGAAQAVTVAGYALIAATDSTRALLYVVCAAEHFAGGMATAALFTCMMDWCAPASSATDYTVQASAVVIATGGAASLSGFSAQALGYVAHFAVATALSVASLLVVSQLFPAVAKPDVANKERAA